MIRAIALGACFFSVPLAAQEASGPDTAIAADPLVRVTTTISVPDQLVPAVEPYMQCIFAAKDSLIGQRISADSAEYREIVLGKCKVERENAIALATKLVASTFDNVDQWMLDVPSSLSEQAKKAK